MDPWQRVHAFLTYLLLPIGWLYALIFHRRSPWVIFHCKQSIALVAWLLLITAGWAAVSWLLAWIPYAFVIGMALFALVIAACFFVVILWIVGMANALRGRARRLPVVGRWAQRLPL